MAFSVDHAPLPGWEEAYAAAGREHAAAVERAVSAGAYGVAGAALAVATAPIWFAPAALAATAYGSYTGTGLIRDKYVSARAARQYRESTKRSTVNSDRWIYYMDVGVWALAAHRLTTTFGVICDQHMLVCDWVGQQGGAKYDASWKTPGGDCPAGLFPISPKLADFLEKAAKMGRCYIWKIAQANRADGIFQLTHPDELVIVVPDLHIPLYANQVVDRFQYKPALDAPMQSLDVELRALLDLAARVGATTVQVGDQYEVWDGELLLRMQYREMLEAAEMRSCSVGPLQTMIARGRVVPTAEAAASIEFRLGEYRSLSNAKVEEDGVDFLSTLDICEHVRRRHRKLFSSSATGAPLERIYDYQINGNHDNFKQNQYWEILAPTKYRNAQQDSFRKLARSTAPGGTRVETVNPEIGKKVGSPVWIEHGHRYDWHNNDRDWWLREHGFDTVMGYLVESAYGIVPSDVLGKRGLHGGEVADWAGNHVPKLMNYTMRQAGLRRFDEIIADNEHVNLVVMGHTHGPDIIDHPCRQPIRFLDEGWQMYEKGSYYYKDPRPPGFFEKYGIPEEEQPGILENLVR